MYNIDRYIFFACTNSTSIFYQDLQFEGGRGYGEKSFGNYVENFKAFRLNYGEISAEVAYVYRMAEWAIKFCCRRIKCYNLWEIGASLSRCNWLKYTNGDECKVTKVLNVLIFIGSSI